MTQIPLETSETRGDGPRPDSKIPIPDVLPVMAIDNIVIFPYMIAPIIVADDRSKHLVDDALGGSRIIGLFAKKTEEEGYTGFEQIFEAGTAGVVLKMLRMPDGSVRLLVHGLSRVRIVEHLAEVPYLRARVEVVEEKVTTDNETLAMTKSAQRLIQEVVELSNLPEDLAVAAMSLTEPGKLCDLIASNLSLKIPEQQEILELADTKVRLRRILAHLGHEIELLKLGEKIQGRVKTAIDKSQREYMLREQMKAIRSELGEAEEGSADLAELRKTFADETAYPEHVRKVAAKELDRLDVMSPNSAEYTVARTYLDWLQILPWNRSTEDLLDIRRAAKILDEDHFDLQKVKERILEFLAVLKLKRDMKGPILCFVGPPGVGKTSLGRSIARALGRKFQRMSLGGLHDEAEIRGHRRTYIGAMPGRIVKAIRSAETNNPVMMLDEIDKVASDFRGDPASALLEVLDPEQNNSFNDNFLDMPFDLSHVMFIATANMLDPIAPALRDRMEILRLSGYTLLEKIEIAKRHLIPKQRDANGLRPAQIAFTDPAIERIIDGYTREAGLRNLEREIGNICRKVARAVAAKRARGKAVIKPAVVARYLGPQRFDRTEGIETKQPGVANGLAWTPNGGEILAIEAAAMPGKGNLVLTGQLGDVMKESAQAALTYLRANADRFDLDSQMFTKTDIHIHVPEGAIPKDGPSAGITIAAALASLLCKTPVQPGIAMTGEITLKGTILPVGGIKEKLLAAHRAGLRRVLLPARNRKDLSEIPKEIRKDLTIKFVSRMPDVIREALPNHR